MIKIFGKENSLKENIKKIFQINKIIKITQKIY
jgi:hypothetical protein